jgi:hypothetical protein
LELFSRVILGPTRLSRLTLGPSRLSLGPTRLTRLSLSSRLSLGRNRLTRLTLGLSLGRNRLTRLSLGRNRLTRLTLGLSLGPSRLSLGLSLGRNRLTRLTLGLTLGPSRLSLGRNRLTRLTLGLTLGRNRLTRLTLGLSLGLSLGRNRLSLSSRLSLGPNRLSRPSRPSRGSRLPAFISIIFLLELFYHAVVFFRAGVPSSGAAEHLLGGQGRGDASGDRPGPADHALGRRARHELKELQVRNAPGQRQRRRAGDLSAGQAPIRGKHSVVQEIHDALGGRGAHAEELGDGAHVGVAEHLVHASRPLRQNGKQPAKDDFGRGHGRRVPDVLRVLSLRHVLRESGYLAVAEAGREETDGVFSAPPVHLICSPV